VVGHGIVFVNFVVFLYNILVYITFTFGKYATKYATTLSIILYITVVSFRVSM